MSQKSAIQERQIYGLICRENGLPTSGGKQELTERIAFFLDTGKVQKASLFREGSPFLRIIIAVINDPLMLRQNFLGQLPEVAGQIFSAFQTVSKLAEGFRDYRIQDTADITDRLFRTRHPELKFIPGIRERGGPVPVGSVLFKSR